uniref:Uncharacterized protein n=1 Tax=Chromera velia CCMP2878 TaxID=1169474 RepID=A0A0G4I4W8_9ALVE|eukprot:Cvel_10948.t1-p1 / transcript=Cvel_10948.t1 / gene=Cvel_10948 / organism=Chromera_velia_CCMP2878 / gene_product=hypothetical protein / transcript_product=hypothetical protein / location=Cvel_scaffold673:37171-38250(-) / protein_length=360 / sequence_SO=supercontig / SO=protein_coding / is_pseudo=false
MQTTELTQCQRFLKNKEDQNFSLQLRLGESQQKEKQTLKWLNLLLEERRGKERKCTQQSGQKECVSDPSGSHVLVGSPPGQSPQVRLHLPPSSAKTNPEAQSLHWSSDQQPEGGAAASSDIQLSKLPLYRQALSQAAPKQTSLPSTGEQAPSVSLSEKVEGVPVSGPVPSPSPSTWKGGEEAARKGEEVRVSDEKEERPNDDKPLPDTEKKEKEGKDGDSLKRPTHEEGTQPNETETEKEPERLPTPNPGKGVHEQPAPKPTYMYPPPYAPPFPSPYPTHLPLGGLHIIRSTAPPAPQPAFPYPPPTPPTLYYPPVPTSHQIPHPVAPPVVLAQPAQSLPHVSTHGRTPSDARGSTAPFL